MSKRVKILLITLLMVISVTAGMTAQDFPLENIKAKTTVDWKTSSIYVDITAALPMQYDVLPDAKRRAKNQISEALPIIMQNSLKDVLINSTETVYDKIVRNLNILSGMEVFSEDIYNTNLSLSTDMSFLKARYTIPLYPDFVSIFINHTYPSTIQPALQTVPTVSFSGIVIYAADAIQVFGEQEMSTLNPCLFPRILSSTGEVILDSSSIPVEIIKKWGYVSYAGSLDEIHEERVGNNPLNIMAFAIYGKKKTDIVIPKEAADKILSKASNIQLLKQGKIVIICPRDKVTAVAQFNNK